MKKILSLVLIMILMVSGLFVLTGCEKNDGGETSNGGEVVEEKKNVDTYEIEAKYGKLTFDIAKDTGYEFEAGTNNGTLTHTDNKSTIKFYLMDTSKSSIVMKETDFSSTAYADYKEVELNGNPGYQIKKSNDFEVQMGFILDDYDKDHGKYHGLKIVVSKNALKTEEFDPVSFVESDVFQDLLKSIKLELAAEPEEDEKEEDKNTVKNYGEFESRTDGLSDKKGLIFIKSFESPNAELYKAEQKNDNVGIDNWLWYLGKSSYNDTSVQVRVFPQDGTFESIDAYKEKKGSMYTWGKTTIAGKEYDTFVFGSSSPAEKYSQYVQGAFMVGNRVVEFSYNMYKDIEDQSIGDTFFNQIINSIEYSKDFK